MLLQQPNLLIRNWKPILLILIIIFGFVFYYEILPRLNLRIAQVGYDKCLNDLATLKAVPLNISQKQGNETITTISPVGVCSEFFVQQYPNICGVNE